MKFSKINLLTLVCTGVFIHQAQADLVMVACPHRVNVNNPDFVRAFGLNPSPGSYATEVYDGENGYNNWTEDGTGNTGPISSAWALSTAVGFTNRVQPAVAGSSLACTYHSAALDLTSYTIFEIRKSTAGYCACTAGVFDILGNQYHFACQTTGCASSGGSSIVPFSNSGMRTAASTLKSLQVPINKTSVGKTSSKLVGVDISTKNVKSASTVFIDAAKKSGIKIVSEQEFKAQK